MIKTMKIYKIAFSLLMGMGSLTSCSDKLDVTNPNQSTTQSFGKSVDDLEEAVIACYHHCRMEGTYARVGYALDVVRGDEVWNSSQQWGYYMADKMNTSTTDEIYGLWPWRDWYYVINISNFVITAVDEMTGEPSERVKRVKGQALFTRALAYYNLAGYYQNPALILNYHEYNDLQKLYASNHQEGDQDAWDQYDRVMDQVETDLKEAMTLLPSRDEGGEWAQGRVTCGAAAGYYARTLMMRHKYDEALVVLKDILSTENGGNQKYGTYKLMENYGDNFREGSAYENNAESLFEIQYLDYGTQGTDDEWTPVNVSKNASQGHAFESNCGPGDFGGWADISASPWLYQLFKAEKTKNNSLDPRLYWTIGTYEDEWDNNPDLLGNVCYTTPMKKGGDKEFVVTNNNYGGLPIAKNTNLRTGLYNKVVVGLKCGINLRLMRYSDVLLRAAECENELNGPTAQAIEWINVVRRRANLKDLVLSDFSGNADKLFEQIANVERPKEFGCEFGRGFDLIRWGFYYNSNRMLQLKKHGVYKLSKDKKTVKDVLSYGNAGVESSYDTYITGHEFFPIMQGVLNDNANLTGNSGNSNSDNSSYFARKGWTIHPVVDL